MSVVHDTYEGGAPLAAHHGLLSLAPTAQPRLSLIEHMQLQQALQRQRFLRAQAERAGTLFLPSLATNNNNNNKNADASETLARNQGTSQTPAHQSPPRMSVRQLVRTLSQTSDDTPSASSSPTDLGPSVTLVTPEEQQQQQQQGHCPSPSLLAYEAYTARYHPDLSSDEDEDVDAFLPRALRRNLPTVPDSTGSSVDTLSYLFQRVKELKKNKKLAKSHLTHEQFTSPFQGATVNTPNDTVTDAATGLDAPATAHPLERTRGRSLIRGDIQAHLLAHRTAASERAHARDRQLATRRRQRIAFLDEEEHFASLGTNFFI